MRKLLCAMVILGVIGLPGLVRAQEEEPEQGPVARKVEHLRELKEKDPEKFGQVVQERRAKLR